MTKTRTRSADTTWSRLAEAAQAIRWGKPVVTSDRHFIALALEAISNLEVARLYGPRKGRGVRPPGDAWQRARIALRLIDERPGANRRAVVNAVLWAETGKSPTDAMENTVLRYVRNYLNDKDRVPVQVRIEKGEERYQAALKRYDGGGK